MARIIIEITDKEAADGGIEASGTVTSDYEEGEIISQYVTKEIAKVYARNIELAINSVMTNALQKMANQR
ncbi:TPA: hypothetical protein JG993_000780 [Vibrio parahaemolyticus]|nr:hypothetical protein [Vibrio parahaemolyticus]HAV2004851.1 hypothetical protein [Vibrio parahaemolyticus]